jgi:hypothetical protein
LAPDVPICPVMSLVQKPKVDKYNAQSAAPPHKWDAGRGLIACSLWR